MTMIFLTCSFALIYMQAVTRLDPYWDTKTQANVLSITTNISLSSVIEEKQTDDAYSI